MFEPVNIQAERAKESFSNFYRYLYGSEIRLTDLLVAQVLYCLGHDISLRIGCVTSNYIFRYWVGSELKRQLINSDKLVTVFPDLKLDTEHDNDDNTVYLQGRKDNRSFSSQMFSTLDVMLGSRLDVIILDPTIFSVDKEEIEEVKDWFRTTVFTKLTNKAKIIVVGDSVDNSKAMSIEIVPKVLLSRLSKGSDQ